MSVPFVIVDTLKQYQDGLGPFPKELEIYQENYLHLLCWLGYYEGATAASYFLPDIQCHFLIASGAEYVTLLAFKDPVKIIPRKRLPK